MTLLKTGQARPFINRGLTGALLDWVLRIVGRRLRLEYPGAVCQVMNRGDRREAIFRDDADRQRGVDTLGGTKQASRRPGWLRVDRLLGEHAIAKDSAAGRRVFEGRLEERRRQGDAGEL